jgi:hypothetical protein
VKERSRAATKVEFASMMQLHGDKAAWCGGRPTWGRWKGGRRSGKQRVPRRAGVGGDKRDEHTGVARWRI